MTGDITISYNRQATLGPPSRTPRLVSTCFSCPRSVYTKIYTSLSLWSSSSGCLCTLPTPEWLSQCGPIGRRVVWYMDRAAQASVDTHSVGSNMKRGPFCPLNAACHNKENVSVRVEGSVVFGGNGWAAEREACQATPALWVLGWPYSYLTNPYKDELPVIPHAFIS